MIKVEKKMDIELELNNFMANHFIMSTHFISPRAEKILFKENIKECDKKFKSKDRFVVDLRMGVLYVLDRNLKECIVLEMSSPPTYNGHITNYQYELAKKICDILNFDGELKLDVIEKLNKKYESIY